MFVCGVIQIQLLCQQIWLLMIIPFDIMLLSVPWPSVLSIVLNLLKVFVVLWLKVLSS